MDVLLRVFLAGQYHSIDEGRLSLYPRIYLHIRDNIVNLAGQWAQL